MHEKLVDGEVWINDQKTGAKLSPYISKYGFWLWNRAGGFGGPHTEVNISPDQFASYITSRPNEKIEVVLKGQNLGKIDECSGYAAVDVGPHTRPITRCVFTIARESKKTKFLFEGQTGFLESTSVAGGNEKSLRSRGQYAFKIWFVIPDEDVELHFKDSRALEAMAAYVST